MDPCPTPDQLERLLEEKLSAAELRAVSAHVAACAACQATLEGLTRDDGGTDFQAVPQPVPRPDAFLARLKQALAPAPRPCPGREPDDTPEPTRPPDPGPEALAWPSVPGYEILGELGRGGMGVVYRARQAGLNRPVALKMIRAGSEATPRDLARFRAEAEAAARLQHPNIVQVYDTGECQGRPYFVLELVEGGSLAARLRGQPQPAEASARLVEVLARAMDCAHQAGVVHRDLKPANVLLAACGFASGEDAKPQAAVPKITDFGLARRLEGPGAGTQTGEVLGTPSYMAPEQAAGHGKAIGPATDVYALGAILYEMLTGRPPFRAETALETVLEVLHHEPVPPRRLRPRLPRDLQTVCLKCLQKDPRQRYASARELADDLRRFLDGESIHARPVGEAERLWRWCRRNPGVAGLSATTFLLLAAVAAGATLGYVREADLRAEAERQRGLAGTAEAGARDEAAKTSHLLYVANMSVVQRDWDAGNLERLGQVLAETRDHPDRGFEWAYWRRQAHFDHLTLRGHAGAVTAVALSPDGGWVLTGGDDRTVRVWDANTGTPHSTLTGPAAAVTAVAFSPDGRLLAAAAADGTARLWDGDGRPLRTVEAHPGGVTAMAFSPDGKRLLTGGEDRTARVWDAADGHLRLTLTGHTAAVRSVDYSPDGRGLVTGSDDGTARVWDAASGREVFTFRGHSGAVTAVRFGEWGATVGTAGADREVKVWETATGRVVILYKGHTWRITCLARCPGGNDLVTGDSDRTVRAWYGRYRPSPLLLEGHTGPVRSVAVARGGSRIVSGSDDGTARVWDLGGRGPRSWPAGILLAGAVSPDGRRLATGGDDRAVRVWDVATGARVCTGTEHAALVHAVAFSPDGRRVVSAGMDGVARVHDAATGSLLLTLAGHTEGLPGVAYSPDGRVLVTAGLDGTARLWDAATGRPLRVLEGHTGALRCVAWSPDGRRIATGSYDRTARVWDADSGRECLVLRGHQDAVLAVAFSPDGRRLATTSWDNTTRVWDAATGRPLRTLDAHRAFAWSVTFSPDGRRILTASVDRTAQLADAATGRELLRLPHPDAVKFALFAPDERRIFTGCDDGAVRVWQAASPEQVASWEAEERAARENRAAARRARAARARAEGAPQDWLVLAPVPLAGGETGAAAVDREQLPNEARLQPRAGERVRLGGRELVWQEHHPDDSFLDFNALLQQRTDFSVAYAVCYVVADAERRGVQFRIGSDDQAKVYLNGREVYRCTKVRAMRPDDDTVADLTLRPGTNVVVFKVVNERLDWKGWLRLTGPDGGPLRGVRVTAAAP